jgi:hypothetical protein
MSIRHGGYRVPLFVPIYLVVIGLGLLAGAAYLLPTDEQFTAGLAAFGGLTMLVTAALLLMDRRRA